MSVEILRMLERIIAALGGIGSIYLGYRLFSIARLENSSSGSLKNSLFTISLTRIGPGVFFALFGAYILVTSVNSRLTFSDASPAFIMMGTSD